jgi:hypothetical protein
MAGDDFTRSPEPAGSIVDFVSQEDRRYFEEHPQARFYDRAPHPLELWPQSIPAKGWMIRVYQITPGFRMRLPYPEGGQPAKNAVATVKKIRRSVGKGSPPPRDELSEDLHFIKAVG